MALYAIALASGQASASVTTVTLFSLSNNRNISFQVYLPPNYNNTSTFRYPVVYDLHGIGGTSLGRSNQVVPTLDSAITSGSVQPMIWIFPDGQTNAFYGNAFDGHKQVYSNIIGEVLPYVDSHYRTLADRKFRAIEGFSMGGFGASMYAAKRSDLFSAVVEYGGALTTWNDLVHFNNAVAVEMYNSVEANFTPYSLWDQTGDNATALAHHTDYAMFVGDADPQMQSNTRFRDHLQSLGINPTFQVLPGIAHDGRAYFAQGNGLHFLADHFARQNKDGFTPMDRFRAVPEPAACASGLAIAASLAAHRRRGRTGH
jgi:enterochelin esterase-like enzyme